MPQRAWLGPTTPWARPWPHPLRGNPQADRTDLQRWPGGLGVL
jgi:hypothetical protein